MKSINSLKKLLQQPRKRFESIDNNAKKTFGNVISIFDIQSTKHEPRKWDLNDNIDIQSYKNWWQILGYCPLLADSITMPLKFTNFTDICLQYFDGMPI